MYETYQQSLSELESKVISLAPDSALIHDKFIISTLHEAITAAKEGNFGVGAVIVDDEDGEIIQKGRNRVLKPYFRSDLHAEMDAMTKFEERHNHFENMKGYTLYVSLEPCPMCLARLINSRINRVYYASPDDKGGMVHLLNKMPSAWIELAQSQAFDLAECTQEFRDVALQIFQISSLENRDKLVGR